MLERYSAIRSCIYSTTIMYDIYRIVHFILTFGLSRVIMETDNRALYSKLYLNLRLGMLVVRLCV